jgi:hypothetical protein
MNAAQKAVRVSKLEPKHQTINALLTAQGQTLAALATAAAVSQDLAERQLSLLVDEGLAARTKGSRTTALYTSI